MGQQFGQQQIWGWSLIATAMVCPVAISANAVFPGIAYANEQELSAWSFDPATQQLEFSLPEGVMPQFFLLAEPARVVLDIPETQLGDVDTERTYDGPVERIRVSQYSDNAVRIVVDLMAGTELESEQADIQFDDVDGRRQWRFRPLITGVVPAIAEDSAIDEGGPFSALGGAEALVLPPSLSADNLQVAQPSPSDTPNVLPIDPYAPAANAEVISVPSLANAPVAPSSPPSLPSIPIENDDVAIVTEVPPMSAPEVTENVAGGLPVQPASEDATLQEGGFIDASSDPTETTDGGAAGPTYDLPTLDATAPIASSDAEPVADEAAPEAAPPAESELSAVEPEIDEGAIIEATPDITEPAPTVPAEEASETNAIATSLAPSMTPLPVTANQTAPESAAPTISGISESKTPAQTTPISVWPEPIFFGQPLPD